MIRDIPIWAGFLLFIGMVAVPIILFTLLSRRHQRREWQKAMRDEDRSSVLDLGTNAAGRIKYLEETNERLVRENAEWKGRANELSLYLDDRERKLKDARIENGATTERAVRAEKDRDEAIERAIQLKRELDQARKDLILHREPVSVERPYGPDRSNRSGGGGVPAPNDVRLRPESDRRGGPGVRNPVPPDQAQDQRGRRGPKES